MTTTADRVPTLGVTVTFAGNQTTLTVRGEVDALTSPDLADVMHMMINAGHRHLTLELADQQVAGDAAMRAILRGAGRVAVSGGTLTVRCPSSAIDHLGSLVGTPGLLLVALPEPGADYPDPGSAVDATGLAVAPRPGDSGSTSDGSIDLALHLLVALAARMVVGADGVSVSLRRGGGIATVAASDQTVLDMDACQYGTGEGPCIDASMAGQNFYGESLRTETRWPAFVPQARALGINAILSSPLLAEVAPVGSLNIYSRQEAAFSAADQRLALVFAMETSGVLADAGYDVHDDSGTRLGGALRSREVIAQAQGVLMERFAVGEDRAYTALRLGSVRSGDPLRHRADDVVASTRPAAPDQVLGTPRDRDW